MHNAHAITKPGHYKHTHPSTSPSLLLRQNRMQIKKAAKLIERKRERVTREIDRSMSRCCVCVNNVERYGLVKQRDGKFKGSDRWELYIAACKFLARESVYACTTKNRMATATITRRDDDSRIFQKSGAESRARLRLGDGRRGTLFNYARWNIF